MLISSTAKRALITSVVVSVIGCAQISQMGEKLNQMAVEERIKTYNSVEDKELVEAIYKPSSDGKSYSLIDAIKSNGYQYSDISPTKLVVRKEMFHLANMVEMSSAMSRYVYDSEGDQLSKAYIEVASKRGNRVKVFRPSLTKIINSIFKQPFDHMQQSAEWYDRDVSLVEYDKQNRPISILVRAHQAQTTVGVNSYMYATIFFGQNNMRFFENNVANNVIENSFLRFSN